jgi:ketosteroid isomerase-like protein
LAYQAGDISCLGEGIEKYFRLFSKLKIYERLKTFQSILLVLFLFLWPLLSCRQKDDLAQKKSLEEIFKADKDFSDLSKSQGMKRAFIEYIATEGILLRPGHPPIVGANAIDYLSQVNDSLYTLTWAPAGGEIAASGDLGYTYGMYKLSMKDTILHCTYVSIWKKQKNGKWKFVLDSGNAGIGQ